jgi:hypothetical protein
MFLKREDPLIKAPVWQLYSELQNRCRFYYAPTISTSGLIDAIRHVIYLAKIRQGILVLNLALPSLKRQSNFFGSL